MLVGMGMVGGWVLGDGICCIRGVVRWASESAFVADHVEEDVYASGCGGFLCGAVGGVVDAEVAAVAVVVVAGCACLVDCCVEAVFGGGGFGWGGH